MTTLEKHTNRYWKSMLKLKRGAPLSKQMAVDMELPNLEIETPFISLKIKIQKELNNVKSTKISK